MRTITVTLLQAAVLLGLGVVVGLGANAVRSRDHIRLLRNYALVIPRPPGPEPTGGDATPRVEPYNLVTLDEVVRIVADTSRFGLDVVLDARNDRAFARGHLPGAIQCDPYNLDSTFDYALSMALGAERVVIYCHGGNCEDSYLLAQELVGHGVFAERIYIFKPGWEAWQARQQNPDPPPAGAAPPAADPAADAALSVPEETPAPEPVAAVAEPMTSPPGPAQRPVVLGTEAGQAAGEPDELVFQRVNLDEVIELFEDHRTTDGVYLFVDARADGPYAAGHIPGAVQCDFYRIDYYLPDILRRAATAEKIIVYCGNHDCEDSLYVCGELLKADIPQARILLFTDGWKAWNEASLPTATGREP